jgi:hypothetical protein
MKRGEWLVWAWGGCLLLAVGALTHLLSTGFSAGSDFVREVAVMRDLQAHPPARFSLAWSTRDGMTAMQENPRAADETVREHVERTVADALQAQEILPAATGGQ